MIHLRGLLCILSVVFTLVSYPVSSGTLPHLSKIELDALPKNGGKKYNRLIFEKSPYLLQHATNPVNWFPWGDEAFERARKENKPIFLSVGYSSCHWCHVMERESFSDAEVAAILNEKYISIKVDREERPDIDSIYMMATQLIQRGRGGWPNSVWLTPDRKPFFAGTYFPKEDRYSRPGFKSVLNQIFGIFSEGRKRVDESAEIIVSAIQDLMGTDRQKATKLDLNSRKEAIRQVEYSLEHLVSPATPGPKFPPHQKLLFLFEDFEIRGKKDRLQMGLKLLRIMASGGIYDQIGGGFHRYSTDEKWFLPHFEKMLYDNAQLAQVYAHAFQITADPLFEQVSRETIEFVLRDMRSPEGAFYSALDADSEGEEGIFYLWKIEEFQKHLGKKEGKKLAQFFRFETSGNYRPEVGETVPYLNLPHVENLVLKSETVKKELGILQTIRSKRIWPLLDDKVLVSWNGLMIRALAFASSALKEPRYLKAAQRSANYILEKMRVKRRLYHNSREGENGVPGYLSDYANLSVALLQLYKVDKNEHWLKSAKSLVDDALQKFKDQENGGFYLTSSEHDVLLAREKAESDNVTPSPAGMMTESLVRLYLSTKDARYLQEAREALLYYSSDLLKSPLQSLSFMGALHTVVSQDDSKPLLKPISAAQRIKAPPSRFQLEKFPLTILANLVPKKSEILVKIQMEDGWHINSSEPYQEYLIATKVEAIPSRGYTFGSIEYPDGIDLELDFSDEGLSVYDGAVELSIPYQAESATRKIHFFLHTQACSDSECKRPEKHNIEVVIQP